MNMKKDTFRQRLSFGAAISAIALGAPGLALAQEPVETGARAQAQGQPQEVIRVTGSRIVRPELSAPSPLTTIGEEDIALSGQNDVVDVLNNLPALIGSDTTADNRGGAGSLGASSLNLRNLGTARTLTLVDGRRHVSGFAGTAAVDVNTIPAALVERVETLTGGASAVYGSDAVTGVVNFIMKRDFEGFDVSAQASTSSRWDGDAISVTGVYGRNFAEGRGNFAAAVSYQNTTNVRVSDRPHTRGDRVGTDRQNPALVIQPDDISGFGLDPLLLGDNIDFYCGAGDTTLGSARDVLCSRAENSPPFAYLPFTRFNLTSYGSLIGVDFFGDGFLSFYPGDPGQTAGLNLGANGVIFDLNNNGIEDCLETVNGTILQRFGGFAGCHITRLPGQGADVFNDGLLASSDAAFGGDGTFSGRDRRDLIPSDERVVVNFLAHYDFTPNVRWFLDAKYARSSSVNANLEGVNGFFDSLEIRYDNPFIPQNLRAAIDTFHADNPGLFELDDVLLFVGRDMTDLAGNRLLSDRETIRIVTGFEGDLPNTAFNYEVSLNYGRTQTDSRNEGSIFIDRFYAAADAVIDPATGQTVCRSDLDPTAAPGGSFLASGGPFRGFETFTPGAGSGCVPLNLFGVGAPSREAADWITTTTERSRTITQTVVSGFVAGDSSDFFTLPAGPIGLAFGAEYRREESDFVSDPRERPLEDPFDILAARSLLFPVDSPTNNTFGSFEVTEIYGEASVPLLVNTPLAEELRLDMAYRYSEYDRLGGQDTWNVGLIWAPFEDLRFRSAVSQTVRAPNINELFSPLQPSFARPVDPCIVTQIGLNPNRAANCAADGLPANLPAPPTTRIGGFTGGNPDLQPETADTFTAGFVLTPRWIPGLSIIVDYYEIEIADAIQSVGLTELLRACYDASTFPNAFCDTFERDTNPASPNFNYVSTFVSTDINFAGIETSGFDYEIAYTFEFGDLMARMERLGEMTLRLNGNYTDKLIRREDPVDNSIINDRLYSDGQPRNAFNLSSRWRIDNLTLNWRAQYWGEILQFGNATIEEADDYLNAWTGKLWRHDASASYRLTENARIFGGVNNVFDEQPILTSSSYPVGSMGRQFFLGVNLSY